MLTRRNFIAGTVALTACHAATAADPSDPPPRVTGSTSPETPKNVLGKTGASVSRLGLGGYHLGKPSEDESIRIVRTAVDRGVTFMDNSWDYNAGESERRMGKALRDGYRERVFLMTKLDGRDQASAASQLDESLRRLQTDRIDLVLVHEVIRTSDPHAVFSPRGAIAALVSARQAGKLRFIGFSGHKDPSIHLEMLQIADQNNFSFDAIMMPLNVMDAQFRSFEQRVLPVAREKNLGVLSMKPLGGGDILKSGLVTATECLQYALSLPTHVVITGCNSMEVLDQAVRAAAGFEPYSPNHIEEILNRTRSAAKTGRYERFKTSDKFDTTAHHPQWLHSASI